MVEAIELKSTQRFCDSNVNESIANQTNACLNIETDVSNQSVIDEDKVVYDTFRNSKELEFYLKHTAKSSSNVFILQRVKTLVSQAKETINYESSISGQNKRYFKRKDSLYTLNTIEFFHRIIEKKYLDVNFYLVKYFEYSLIYESVSELTSDKEALVKLINSIFSLIKSIDSQIDTYILENRLQTLIKKVLLLNSSANNPNEATIKNALTPLLVKEEINEEKKKELGVKLTEILKKKINTNEKKDKKDEALKEISEFIKEKFCSSKEHYEIMLDPLLEFIENLNLNVEEKLEIIYEFLCYFIFPLLPNFNYTLNKNEVKQEQKPFGLYNPVLMIKNNEVATKTYTLLNFIDGNHFDLIPQFNLSFYSLDLLLGKLSNIFLEENSSQNVNLRFALFVIFKRILLLKEHLHLLKFSYGHSEIEHLISTISDCEDKKAGEENEKEKNEKEKEKEKETSINTTENLDEKIKEDEEKKTPNPLEENARMIST